MQHHSSSNRHDGLDGSLGVSVVVVSSNSGELDHLLEDAQSFVELLGSEASGVV